jgi:hypothetical protein
MKKYAKGKKKGGKKSNMDGVSQHILKKKN